ncbi:MAG: hypothetical protein WD576_02660 [Nitriliruptoraceae bacterium]
MSTAAAVLALVLIMTAVGSSGLLWLAPTFGAVRHGYEYLTGSTVAVLAWAGWAALAGPLVALEGSELQSQGELARTLLMIMVGLTVAAMAALAVRLPAMIGRLLGLAATIVGASAFYPLAVIRAERVAVGGVAQGLIELLLGAVFMSAIWVGMVLGHWYLVERRLSNRYMVWMAWANVVGVVAGLVSVLLSARNPAPCIGLTGAAYQQCAMTFAPMLRIGSMTVTLGLGVLVLIAIIAAFNVRLAKEGGRSIQASTGMFYLAVILAPAVEFAAKVRFF